MKRTLFSLVAIVLAIVFLVGCPTDPLGPGGYTEQQAEDASIGFATIIFVAFTEISYATLAEDESIEGMSGTIGDIDTAIDVAWDDCDIGLLLGGEDAVAGEMVIESGTHVVSLSGGTLHTDLDVTITFAEGDDADGTYHVIYRSEITGHGTDAEEEEILQFTVNGRNVNMAVYEDLLDLE